MKRATAFVCYGTLCALLCAQASAGNLVVNGNFERGNTGFTGGYTYVAAPNLINTEGEYTIGANPSKVSIYSDWG